jgi:hypothetical protein
MITPAVCRVTFDLEIMVSVFELEDLSFLGCDHVLGGLIVPIVSRDYSAFVFRDKLSDPAYS